ncbi:CASP8 and FADD-like apoptosis regulator [Gouania willdenowi]|uniref:CASP8 and FADD-like apoptosis regulator n=1 Tax=Gouania willdenowi TaxID=441366 RepID=UPI0010567120|nr:CASP8 and FADD-like apoptosis regulator [Gouania willdenowi]XP_028292118.1 CASP8 and FADD-like apoptosis regulator [Gouania willdenowi]XP_028292119.1 CASP8 and FADD-like apoptosis regulator [Gouania willdenowi]XP_028292120.1 CASP8 and FADD-like apoptosis regulator [Gouania willdenowi]
MAPVDHRQLQQISQIAEALSSEERTTLSYLCESTVRDPSPAQVKDLLSLKVVGCDESPQLFLAELLLRLGRYDIMKKVCGVSRDAMESNLKCTQVLSGFRVLMVDLSEDMNNGDVDRLKFLLSSTLSLEKTENAKNFLHLMAELEKLDMVSPKQVDFVEDCLLNIGRIDLARRVTSYKKSVQTTQTHSRQQKASERSLGQFLPFDRGNLPLVSTKQNSELLSDCYKLNMIPRGVCVIIDCVGNDGEMLEKTFKALQYNVSLYKWQSIFDICSTLMGILKKRENLNAGSFICCIISRGTGNYLLGTDSSDRGLHLNLIRKIFTAELCPMLVGRPKIFFIQTYSVSEPCLDVRVKHRDEDLETDGASLPTSSYIPTDADIFWSQCWTDVCQLEKGQHHSIYLKALTEALENPQRRNLVDIHTGVNKAIFEYNQRDCEWSYHIDVKHTLRKKLYLQ